MGRLDLDQQLKPGKVVGLHRETPRDAHDANTIIVALLMRLGGGVTLSASEFIEAEKLVGKLQALPEKQGRENVMHFRVNL